VTRTPYPQECRELTIAADQRIVIPVRERFSGCWNRKALQHFPFGRITAENRRPLFRKMLCLDWNYLGISRIWREKYIEFLKLRDLTPHYTSKLRKFQTKIGVSRLIEGTASPEQNKPGAPMADRVGHTSEGCLFVLELRFNCKSFFSTFLARYHNQPKAPLGSRTLRSIAQKYRET
jgi:hypothetical protein